MNADANAEGGEGRNGRVHHIQISKDADNADEDPNDKHANAGLPFESP